MSTEKALLCVFFLPFFCLISSLPAVAQDPVYKLQYLLKLDSLEEAESLLKENELDFFNDSLLSPKLVRYSMGLLAEKHFLQKKDTPKADSLLSLTLLNYRRMLSVKDSLYADYDQNTSLRVRRLYTELFNEAVKSEDADFIIRRLWQAHRILPEDSLPLMHIERIAEKSGQFDDLIRAGLLLLERGKGRPALYLKLLKAAEKLEKPKQFLQAVLNEAKYFYPENAAFRRYEINKLNEAGIREQFLKKLNDLLEKEPENREVRLKMIGFMLNDRPYEAIRHCDSLLVRDTTDTEALYHKGLIFYNLGVNSLTKARTYLPEKTEKESDRRTVLYFRKAYPYLKLAADKLPEKSESIKKALALIESEESRFLRKFKPESDPANDTPNILTDYNRGSLVITRKKVFEVSGIVLDRDSIFEVRVNGKAAELGSSDAFETSLRLREGINHISVEAEDFYGNTAEFSFAAKLLAEASTSEKLGILILRSDSSEALLPSDSLNLPYFLQKHLNDTADIFYLNVSELTEDKKEARPSGLRKMSTYYDRFVLISDVETCFIPSQGKTYFIGKDTTDFPEMLSRLSLPESRSFLMLSATSLEDPSLRKGTERSKTAFPGKFGSFRVLSSSPECKPENLTDFSGRIGFVQKPQHDFFSNAGRFLSIKHRYQISLYDLFLFCVITGNNANSLSLKRLFSEDEGGDFFGKH